MERVGALAEMLLKNVGADLPGEQPGDYRDIKDGLLYCGVCKEPKETLINLPFDGFENRIVRCQCRCEREKYEEEERQRKLREDRDRIEKLRRLSLMDEKVVGSTFGSFRKTPDNEKILKICTRYAEAFDTMVEKNQGLLFWGAPGTGKTFAAACIANFLLDSMQTVVMTSFVKLIAELQRKTNDDDEEDVIRRINRAKLLIIDDLGAERSTDYALERVYNVVDSRYRAKKPMILTTNLSLREMQSTTDLRYARIYDRVFEVCYPVEFKGMSWRYAEAARRYDEMKDMLER